MHPIRQLLIERPAWLAEHLQAYAALAWREGGGLLQDGRRRALLLAGAALSLLLALTLSGMALLLWAVQGPGPLPPQAWLLWAVPLLPWLALGACLRALRRHPAVQPFALVRQQAREDLALIHGAPRS